MPGLEHILVHAAASVLRPTPHVDLPSLDLPEAILDVQTLSLVRSYDEARYLHFLKLVATPFHQH